MHNDLAGDNNSDVEVKFFFWCHYISYSYNIIIKFRLRNSKKPVEYSENKTVYTFFVRFFKVPKHPGPEIKIATYVTSP
jgi:hypothetical protein